MALQLCAGRSRPSPPVRHNGHTAASQAFPGVAGSRQAALRAEASGTAPAALAASSRRATMPLPGRAERPEEEPRAGAHPGGRRPSSSRAAPGAGACTPPPHPPSPWQRRGDPLTARVHADAFALGPLSFSAEAPAARQPLRSAGLTHPHLGVGWGWEKAVQGRLRLLRCSPPGPEPASRGVHSSQAQVSAGRRGPAAPTAPRPPPPRDGQRLPPARAPRPRPRGAGRRGPPGGVDRGEARGGARPPGTHLSASVGTRRPPPPEPRCACGSRAPRRAERSRAAGHPGRGLAPATCWAREPRPRPAAPPRFSPRPGARGPCRRPRVRALTGVLEPLSPALGFGLSGFGGDREKP